MESFDVHCSALFAQLGNYGHMVLSTSSENNVTARMMSVVIINGVFYFQTDRTSRKHAQLQKNPKAAFCRDNFQLEGTCKEIGFPREHSASCQLYQSHFPNAYMRYTHLSNERLWAFYPEYVKKWLYDGGKPYEEVFDFLQRTYCKKIYAGE